MKNGLMYASSIEKDIPVATQDLVKSPTRTTVMKNQDNLHKDLDENPHGKGNPSKLKVVLVAGFESFNRDLYYKASQDQDIDLVVFADSEIRVPQLASQGEDGSPWRINPQFAGCPNLRRLYWIVDL